MSEQHTTKRIENNTGRFIILPSTPSHPAGKRLIPGLNTVPVMYLDELEGYCLESAETKVGNRKVAARKRFPGKECLAKLQKPVRIVTANGESFGPQITIYEDALEDRPDGPPPPQSLPQNKQAAFAIINVTHDRVALERWSKQGRGEIAQAAATKLAGLHSTMQARGQ